MRLLIVIYLLLLCSLGWGNNKTHLVIKGETILNTDTMEIRVWESFVGHPNTSKNSFKLYKSAKDGYGDIHFRMEDMPDMAWLSLHFDYQKRKGRASFGILEYYLVERGDSIVINLEPRFGKHTMGYYDNGSPAMQDNWEVSFSGKGAPKYEARWEVDRQQSQQENPFHYPEENWILMHLQSRGELLERRKQSLAEYQTEISTDIYAQMQVDIEGEYLYACIDVIRKAIKDREVDRIKYSRVIKLLDSELRFEESSRSTEELTNICRSWKFLSYIQEYIEFRNHLELGNLDFIPIYERIEKNISDRKMKDHLWAQHIFLRFKDRNHISYVKKAIEEMDDPACLQALLPLLHTESGADVSLDFVLADQANKEFRLSEFGGKVILLDFWFAGCIPCRKYMVDVLKPISEKYSDNEAFQLITVSIDQQKRFQQALSSEFLPEHALYLYTEGLGAKHPIIQYYGVAAYPFPVLINREGQVVDSGKALKSLSHLHELLDTLL